MNFIYNYSGTFKEFLERKTCLELLSNIIFCWGCGENTICFRRKQSDETDLLVLAVVSQLSPQMSSVSLNPCNVDLLETDPQTSTDYLKINILKH